MDALHNFLRAKFSQLTAQCDRVGNILFCSEPKPRKILLGSHLDTVSNAGRFDGVLGVAIGLVAASHFRSDDVGIDVVGFADEEGAGFGLRFLGSLNFVGTLPPHYLSATDRSGVSLGSAMSSYNAATRDNFAQCLRVTNPIFIEPHIEQGLFLKTKNKPLGIVDRIFGQTVCSLIFAGKSAHTVSKWGRQGALGAACDLVSITKDVSLGERNLYFNIGGIENRPNQSNVVSDHCLVKIDVRHMNDSLRKDVMNRVMGMADSIAQFRKVRLTHSAEERQTAEMTGSVLSAMGAIVGRHLPGDVFMPSYAGHDAMIMRGHVASGLVFVRDQNGISHHPDELVVCDDVAVVLRSIFDFAMSHDIKCIRGVQ